MDKLIRRIFAVIALVYLSMTISAVTIFFDVFPSEYFLRGVKGGYALYLITKNHLNTSSGRPSEHSWYPARSDAMGLTKHDVSKTKDDVTFYLVSPLQKAELLSMDGKVLHTWHLPYSKIWEDGDLIDEPIEDKDIAWEFAFPFPNGDIIVIFRANYKVPYGYGMAKIDKDSNLIWKNLDSFHHELDVSADGRIFAMSQYITERTIPGAPQIESPMVEDFLVELDSNGKILRKISVFDALLDSPFKLFLKRVPSSQVGDYLHVNSVEYIDEQRANVLPFANEGDLLVSLRNPSMVIVVNMDEGKVVWALHGPWINQHDTNILANGNILIFDNRGHIGSGGVTRVLEYDAIRQATIWEYTGSDEEPFESAKRGSQDRLDNGNTLITESHAGRLFEVDRNGSVVWEYYTPERWIGEKGDSYVPYIRYARRFPENWFRWIRHTDYIL